MTGATLADGRSTSSKPARVLFLGHGAERTGPPILLANLLRGLSHDDAWVASVLVARSGPLLEAYRRLTDRAEAVASGREPFEPVAAGLRRLGLGSTANHLTTARRRQVARRLADTDLVYVNSATPPTAALLRALDPEPSTPVIVHVHELDVGLRLNLREEDRTMLFERADHLIAASEAVRQALVGGHGLIADRITVCEEFIDVAAVHPLPADAARAQIGVPAGAEVVGSVGLPDWRKDPEHLLRAAASLTDRPHGPPWVVWIGGDPASVDGRHLADEARRLGMTDRFVHVSHQDDPTSLLSALDVFALPAREDALPLAALEAAAAGLPLVCFRTGGVAALCDAGAGRAVAYPATTAFSAALAELLDDRDLRMRTGAHGQQLVRERHDVGVGVARIVTVLDQVLARRHPLAT